MRFPEPNGSAGLRTYDNKFPLTVQLNAYVFQAFHYELQEPVYLASSRSNDPEIAHIIHYSSK